MDSKPWIPHYGEAYIYYQPDDDHVSSFPMNWYNDSVDDDLSREGALFFPTRDAALQYQHNLKQSKETPVTKSITQIETEMRLESDKLNKLADELAKAKLAGVKKVLNDGDVYYWADKDGSIISDNYYSHNSGDRNRLATGNHFSTPAEAATFAKFLAALGKSRQFPGAVATQAERADYETRTYNIMYCHKTKKFVGDFWWSYQAAPTVVPVFPNAEARTAYIEYMGEDSLKALFGVV